MMFPMYSSDDDDDDDDDDLVKLDQAVLHHHQGLSYQGRLGVGLGVSQDEVLDGLILQQS